MTIQATSRGSNKIGGFLLQARRVDHTLNQVEPLGTFTPLEPDQAQLLKCNKVVSIK